MKILVLQLARLGDILMGWPTLRALRRKYPDAEIHLMVRPRFKIAAEGCDAINKIVEFDTASFIEPFTRDGNAVEEASARVTGFIESLRAENYGEVINLTFSPLSSQLVYGIAEEDTVVRGYSRFDDGTLRICDGVSSYFFAQVGPGRNNRIHLTDIFAALADVNLDAEDWRGPATATKSKREGPYIVVHAGASQANKMVPAFLWGRIVKNILKSRPELKVVLIGDAREQTIAEEVSANTGFQCENLCGKTSWNDVVDIVRGADLLLGGDSAPLHIASLTGTKTLNVSVGPVNFWETGPRAAGSVVLRYETADAISAYFVADCAQIMLAGADPQAGFTVQEGVPGYRSADVDEGEFAWSILAGMYLDQPFPVADDMKFLMAVRHLINMNDVVINQLNSIDPFSETLGQLVDRSDQVMQAVGKLVPEADIIVRWLLTEKTRIPPSTPTNVCREMLRLHLKFGEVLKPYDMDLVESKGV